MRIARAILVFLTALSVAAVPVAGAMARAASPMTYSAHHEECCPPGEHCDDHAKKDCAKDAACALKCASLSAAPLTSPETAFTPYSSAGSALILAIALSLGPNPPSPPPRV
jgi:hypothetical protein